MRLVNSPKMILESYWQKHSDDRKRLSVSIRSVVNKILWLIYQPYKWLFVVPLLILTTTACGSLILTTSFILPSRYARFFAIAWARINSFFTPMTVGITGFENIDPRQSYVIIANHQSLYDIYVLYGWIGIDFKWVMKKELENVPVLGPACKALGHIFIDRSDTEKAVESINAARKKIVNGTSVLFFPEGSRSSDGLVGPFKKGAFKMALDLGLPVLPITLSGTSRILPKGSVNLLPGSVSMVIHPPIPVEGLNENAIKSLINHSRSAILSALN